MCPSTARGWARGPAQSRGRCAAVRCCGSTMGCRARSTICRNGTMAPWCAISGMRLSADPLVNLGLQDISAWVDFTRVAEASREADFELAGFTTQAHFLAALQIDREMRLAAGGDDNRFARLANQARQLLMPGEMGERFKAMAWLRGLDMPLARLRAPRLAAFALGETHARKNCGAGRLSGRGAQARRLVRRQGARRRGCILRPFGRCGRCGRAAASLRHRLRDARTHAARRRDDRSAAELETDRLNRPAQRVHRHEGGGRTRRYGGSHRLFQQSDGGTDMGAHSGGRAASRRRSRTRSAAALGSTPSAKTCRARRWGSSVWGISARRWRRSATGIWHAGVGLEPKSDRRESRRRRCGAGIEGGIAAAGGHRLRAFGVERTNRADSSALASLP